MGTRPRAHVSLDRALSKLGIATRSDARAMIAAGRVTVDGRQALDPAQAVVPERIQVAIDGLDAHAAEPVTIALHKPRGVVSTRRDPHGRRTVYDLIADLEAHVVPVGRLDYATSGLLLLTNDTRLADWLTDPRHEIPRIYLVTVRGRIDDEAAAALERGVAVEGERLVARSARVRKASRRESLIVVELVEGKNRELRRMTAALGKEVTRLRRVQFGGVTLEGLPPGAWRRLSRKELAQAFPSAPLARLRAQGLGLRATRNHGTTESQNQLDQFCVSVFLCERE